MRWCLSKVMKLVRDEADTGGSGAKSQWGWGWGSVPSWAEPVTGDKDRSWLPASQSRIPLGLGWQAEGG